MKTKVLYLITKATWGGAQKYVFDLATHMPAEHQSLLAYGTKGKLAENLSDPGIATFQLSALSRDIAILSDIKSFFEIWRLLRREKPDVLHLNSSKAAALGAFAGRLAGVRRIVFTAHGWPFKEERGTFSKMVIQWISWCTALLSHAVIVVSKEDEMLGKEMWLVGKKIQYVPLALSQVYGMYSREQAENVLFSGISASFRSAIRLVTIAELTPNKGLSYGLDMMAQLEKRAPGKYKYAIVGDGEERSSLEAEAQKKNLVSSVWFVRIHPPANLPPNELSSEASKFLRAFDIFILPSIKEGMPYVLLEAAAAGLPIVATDIVQQEAPNFQDIHLVESKSGAALADAVEEITKSIHAHTPDTVGSFEKMLTDTFALY